MLWAARASQELQTVLFSIIQPTLSGVVTVTQSRVREHWRKHVQYSHILEVLVTFQSFVYGETFSDDFTAWRQPLFAFVSYTLGILFILLCVLFIAPHWKCGNVATDDDAKADDGAEDATKRNARNVDIEQQQEYDDSENQSDSDTSYKEPIQTLSGSTIVIDPIARITLDAKKKVTDPTDIRARVFSSNPVPRGLPVDLSKPVATVDISAPSGTKTASASTASTKALTPRLREQQRVRQQRR